MPVSSRRWFALVLGLIASGIAGIVNQVAWQRGLKVVLGGSETLSSMVVVLVFLGGLGLGAALASSRASRSRNPLRSLAWIEAGLVCVNAVVAVVLGLDVSETVYAVQRLAVAVGLPLRLVYALAAGLVLAGPTLLMGATIPLASEAAQRQLGASDARLVPVLFFINTAGAAVGAVVASLWWLPWHGQRFALFGAVALNALAAVILAGLGRGPGAEPRTSSGTSSGTWGGRLRWDEVLGGVLGFVSLGYEMMLFRALALAHGPLPATFAAGLAAFLITWAVGTALSNRVRAPVSVAALATGVCVAALPWLHGWDAARVTEDFGELSVLGPAALVLSLPVVGFGWLYGLLVTRAAGDWGRDVGRYSAVNTVGSCLGVVFFTLVAHEAPLGWASTAAALWMLAVAAAEWASSQDVARERTVGRGGAVGAVLAGLVVLGIGVSQRTTEDADGVVRYWGRDGVVEVHPDGDVLLDGLWHTRLTDGPDGHVGRPYTWVMAAAAVLAHSDPHPKRALVIGAGVGVSGVTLAGVDGLEVDGYEINHTLRRLLEDRPHQTLGALEHPSLRWIWQDARTGLALDETEYDIILSAPLHLRQAGSSLLLSREYLRLVKSRLAEDGVVAVYSNEGPGAQTLLVQATLAEAFAYRTTWFDGIVTIASDHPITVTEALLAERMARPDLLYRQMRALDAERADSGGMLGLWDGSAYTEIIGDHVIVDNWPLVEHPEVADQVVTEVAAP